GIQRRVNALKQSAKNKKITQTQRRRQSFVVDFLFSEARFTPYIARTTLTWQIILIATKET
ncbi:hypothetical protein, partial [Lactobacillus helveticus]|uniref:hypothetical protein n=1 Tax=Lactobacillus helveticus TaxID=1587 RepID=UPI001C27B665